MAPRNTKPPRLSASRRSSQLDTPPTVTSSALSPAADAADRDGAATDGASTAMPLIVHSSPEDQPDMQHQMPDSTLSPHPADHAGDRPETRPLDLQALYTPITLSEPNRLVFPPPWIGHIPFAFWIIEALRPTSLVELGTHSGNSYCAFLQAIAACGLSTSCYAVDTWEGDPHAGLYGDDVYEDLRAHHDAAYAGFSRLLRMTFDQALEYFPDASIDLLHIDGLHTYEAVGQDFRSWLPKMSGRGLVLFHDINVRERGFGVWQVWEEVSAAYPSFSFLHSNGLGVAYVGKPEAMPPALRWLFEVAGERERLALVRRNFDRLGQGLIDRFWAQHRLKQIGDYTKHADALSAQVADREATIERLTGWVAERDTDLRALQAHAADTDRQLHLLMDALGEREHQLAEAEAEAERQTAEVQRQTAHACALQDELARQTHRLEAMERSTSWRATAGLRWASTRSRTAIVKARFIVGISRRALPMLLSQPECRRQTLESVHREGLRPAWRRIIQQVQGSRTPVLAPAALEAPSFPEVARPIEIDHSVAVPFGHRPPLAVDPSGTPPTVAVVCHLFHENLAVEFRRYFLNIPVPADLFLSTSDPFKKSVIEKAFSGWDRGRVEVRVTPNRGRDIAPKLLGFRDVYDRYELVLHLHSKQSDHASVLANWRGQLLETLLGSPEVVESIIGAFVQRPDLGMIASQHFEPVRHWINWGNNFPYAAKLMARLGRSLSEIQVLDFPSGSMFWARSAALKPLLDLDLSYEDFAEERGQIDGTLAHAIERTYYHVCETAGFGWIKVAVPDLFPSTPAIAPINSPADLDRFIVEHGLKLTGGELPAPRSVHPTPIAQPDPALIDRRSAKALGLDNAVTPAVVAVGIVTYNNDEAAVRRIVESTRLALVEAGCPTDGRILVIDNGASTAATTAGDPAIHRLDSAGNIGFGAGHNRLMAAAFAAGADHYIAANPDGAFHPQAVLALLRMMQAQQDRALIEALQFPVEHPKPYDPFTFETPWLSGACLMIPHRAFEELGGFDESFFMYCEDVDLSWRARANGFVLLSCPAALFLHEVTNRPRNPTVLRMIHESGMLLARKWGAPPAFHSWVGGELRGLGHPPPETQPEPVPADWRRYADFSHHFSFAKARW